MHARRQLNTQQFKILKLHLEIAWNKEKREKRLKRALRTIEKRNGINYQNYNLRKFSNEWQKIYDAVIMAKEGYFEKTNS